jgi:TfoX/Sxy family transcriptional regulator of competence genes
VTKVHAAEQLFESVAEPLLASSRVTQSRMFGSTGLRVSGKVFAMVVKGKLVVKLPEARVDALVASRKGRRFDSGHGHPAKEWVAVASASKVLWRQLVAEARQFVASVR